MGQKTIKRTKKIAEKVAKAQALELAKAQLMDIANSPFKIRWQFCKAILFPKKLRVSGDRLKALRKVSYGGDILDSAQASSNSQGDNQGINPPDKGNQGEGPINGRPFGLIRNQCTELEGLSCR
jgi:hypothetical protein